MDKTELKELTEIEEIEKKYFQDLKLAIEKNMCSIEEGLDFINKNKRQWREALKLDNAIQKAVQEMVRVIIFRFFNKWKTFSLPICSDTAFQTEDAIINLDIKTVKSIDNDAKQGYLQIRRNQVSYPNVDVKNIPWEPHQPKEIKIGDKNIPTFSYFVKFIWERENDDIKIKEVVLCSVPNGRLSKVYGDNFIVNYKTYEYENKTKIKGDTARFDIKKIAEPKLTKGWKRLDYFNFGNQTTLK